MHSLLVSVRDGAMRGCEVRRTPWIALPSGCSALLVRTTLESAPEAHWFGSWVEIRTGERVSAQLSVASRHQMLDETLEIVRVRQPNFGSARLAVESRGDEDAFLYFSIDVYDYRPGTPPS